MDLFTVNGLIVVLHLYASLLSYRELTHSKTLC